MEYLGREGGGGEVVQLERYAQRQRPGPDAANARGLVGRAAARRSGCAAGRNRGGERAGEKGAAGAQGAAGCARGRSRGERGDRADRSERADVDNRAACRGVSDWYGVRDAACPLSTREGGGGGGGARPPRPGQRAARDSQRQAGAALPGEDRRGSCEAPPEGQGSCARGDLQPSAPGARGQVGRAMLRQGSRDGPAYGARALTRISVSNSSGDVLAIVMPRRGRTPGGLRFSARRVGRAAHCRERGRARTGIVH